MVRCFFAFMLDHPRWCLRPAYAAPSPNSRFHARRYRTRLFVHRFLSSVLGSQSRIQRLRMANSIIRVDAQTSCNPLRIAMHNAIRLKMNRLRRQSNYSPTNSGGLSGTSTSTIPVQHVPPWAVNAKAVAWQKAQGFPGARSQARARNQAGGLEGISTYWMMASVSARRLV